MGLKTFICVLTAVSLLSACIGGNKGTASNIIPPPPTVNTLAVIVDSGPAAATGQINHAYVTVKVCAPGSATQCTNIDHVFLDTASFGLRLVRSVLSAGSVTLAPQTDAQGLTIEECEQFFGGQTWGPVALADVTLAGEVASKLPVQIMDDTNAGAPTPTSCGSNGSVNNTVTLFAANGVLGIGVLAQDCGAACAAPNAPPPQYYGCTAAGVCTPENVAIASQVTNPVTLFASDNNGVIVDLPALQNANGDATVQGQLIFGIGSQADNALPVSGLVVLATDANGDFMTAFNGATTAVKAFVDSGTDAYAFGDPTMNPINECNGDVVPAQAAWSGYYCPTTAPQSVSAINTASGASGITDTVNFALADPTTFVGTAAAVTELGGVGDPAYFIWGMPFFYGRKIYVGIEQRAAGSLTGPYFAY